MFESFDVDCFWVSCLNEVIRPLIEANAALRFQKIDIQNLYFCEYIERELGVSAWSFLGITTLMGIRSSYRCRFSSIWPPVGRKLNSSFKAGIHISFRILFVAYLSKEGSLCVAWWEIEKPRGWITIVTEKRSFRIAKGDCSSLIMC